MPNESEVVNAFEWHISGNRWSHLSLLRRGNGNGLDNAKLIETEKGFCHIHKCIQYSPILFHFTLLAELFYECRIDKNRDRTLCAAPSICGDVPRLQVASSLYFNNNYFTHLHLGLSMLLCCQNLHWPAVPFRRCWRVDAFLPLPLFLRLREVAGRSIARNHIRKM